MSVIMLFFFKSKKYVSISAIENEIYDCRQNK